MPMAAGSPARPAERDFFAHPDGAVEKGACR